MSTIGGLTGGFSGCISQCGQYQPLLFKSVNELNGLEINNASEAYAQKLADDKVTLSSDAISIAKAELEQSSNSTIKAPTPVSETFPILNNTAAKSSFYTIV